MNRCRLRLRRHHGGGTAVERVVCCAYNEGVHGPEYALKHFGKRLLKYYQELGMTGVQLSERERAIIAEHQIKVTHMPLGNCAVGAALPPFRSRWRRG